MAGRCARAVSVPFGRSWRARAQTKKEKNVVRARPGWSVGDAQNCKSVSFRKIARDSWPISHGCKFWPKKSTTIQKTQKHAKSTKKYRKRARTAENVLKLGHGGRNVVHLANIARQIWPNLCIWPGSRARSGQIRASGRERAPEPAKFVVHLSRNARQI